MRRLLLVSYYFPPLGGSGVFRPLRLSKYLPRHGWEVTVLTVSDRVRVLVDRSLLPEVHPDTTIERTPTLEPRTLFIALNRLGLGRLVRRIEPWMMLPDDQRGWAGFAVRRGARILRERPHDAVLSTAGPYTAHLVGLELKRRAGIPWVADFRDEWTTNPYLADRYPTAWHRRLNEKLERRVLGAADRVVSVSGPWLDAIRGNAPVTSENRFRVLPNGYDGEHFPAVPDATQDKFRIVYTGTFYGHRSPTAFLRALSRVVDAGRIPPERLEVVFMGHGGAGPEGGALPAGTLRALGHRSYFESLELQRRAALLLLVVPPEGGAGNHTGKLFPYLASGRPILALAPEGNVAAELVLSSRSGRVAPPDDVDTIARAVERAYDDWSRGVLLPDQDRALIAGYEADRQAAEWAAMLDELCEAREAALTE